MDGREKVAFVIIMVAIMVVGTIGAFALERALEGDDPYAETRVYEADGTIDGSPSHGNGTATYAPENDAYRTYSFELRMSLYDDGVETIRFGMVFTSDDRPDDSIFTYVRTEEGLDVWTAGYNGMVMTFWVSDLCKVMKVHVLSERYDVVAMMTDIAPEQYP